MASVALLANDCLDSRFTNKYFVNKVKDETDHTMAKNVETADYLIIQTCAMTGQSISENFKLIHGLTSLYNNKKIILIGCFIRIPGMIEEIKQIYPGIEIIEDVEWVIPTLNYINNTALKRNYNTLIESHSGSDHTNILMSSSIVSGCPNQCSFCKTHYMDNSVRSIPYDSIIEYYTNKIKNGTKCINLHGDNLTVYGIDIEGKPLLHRLIRDLSQIDGLIYLNLNEITVNNMYPELLAEIKNNNKIKEVSIQLETASDRLLNLMNRNYSSEMYAKLVMQLREYKKDLLITTVLLSGFPTETYDDIDTTIKFVRDNQLYVYGTCKYDDCDFIPSHNMGLLSKKDCEEHTQYTAREVRKYKQEYLSSRLYYDNNMIAVQKIDNFTIFMIPNSPIFAYSYNKEFANISLGDEIEPRYLQFVKRNKIIKSYGYSIK